MNKISICIIQDKSTEKILNEFDIKKLKVRIKDKTDFDCEDEEDRIFINLIIKLHSFDNILNEHNDENKPENYLNLLNKEQSKII